MMRYEILTAESGISERQLGDLNHLLDVLTEGRVPPQTLEKWREEIDAPHQRFVAAIDSDGRIVGKGSVILGRQTQGNPGFVEGVVVAPSHQRQGIAENINIILIEEARAARMERVDLSSNPKRVPANNLYRKLGYEDRNSKSNHYRFRIK